MPWTAKGDAACDTCGTERACVPDRHLAIQMMRAGGWRHMKGTTLGGQEFETIICSPCTKGEYKRSRGRRDTVQQELPLDFEEGRVVARGEGVQSR
jgi:hypothetical protein